MPSRARLLRRVLLAALVLVIVSAFGMILHPRGREILIAGVSWLRAAGPSGQLIAITSVVIGIPLGLPTLWFGAMIGYLFGIAAGIPLALVALPLGATAAFVLTRWLLFDEVRDVVSKRPALRATVAAVGEGGWRLVALLRVAGPHNLLNVILAASPISTRGFVAGTALGGAPSFALAATGGALAPDAAALWQAGKSVGAAGVAVIAVGAMTFVMAIVLVRRSAKRALARAAVAE